MENYTTEEQFGTVPTFKNVEAFLDDNVPALTDKTKIYIDLSKCTEEQRKHIYSIIRDRDEFLKPDSYTYDCWKMLNYSTIDERWLCSGENWDGLKGKTELTYPDFIKLFEGGETIKSDNTQTLAKALQQIEKLEADKAELLEALQYVYGKYKKDGHLLNVSPSKIESLIQKMKP